MKNIYLISGLGSDERIFDNYSFKNYTINHIRWIAPLKNESIVDYAGRLGEQIKTDSNNVFLGVSFGGLLAIELSKLHKPDMTIIVSSAKTRNELQPFYRLIGFLKINRILPMSLLKRFKFLARYYNGVETDEGLAIFNYFVSNLEPKLYRWSIDKVLNWKNQDCNPELVHIHGTKDKIFPVRYINDYIPIENGKHFMIIERAGEIQKVVNELIESQ